MPCATARFQSGTVEFIERYVQSPEYRTGCLQFLATNCNAFPFLVICAMLRIRIGARETIMIESLFFALKTPFQPTTISI